MVNAQNRKRSNSSGPGSAKKPKFGGRPGSNGPPSAGKFGGRPGSNGRPSAGKFGKRSGSNGPPSAGKFDKRSNSNGSAFGKKPKFGQHEDSSPASFKQEKTRFPVGKASVTKSKAPNKAQPSAKKQKAPAEESDGSDFDDESPVKKASVTKSKAPSKAQPSAKKQKAPVEESDDSDFDEPPAKKVAAKPKKIAEPKPEKLAEKVVEPKLKKVAAPKAKKQADAPVKKQSKGLVSQNEGNTVPLYDVDAGLVAENEKRLTEQKKRSLYVGLPGALGKTSNSVLKAFHPDILNVKRIANAAFLIFSAEPVRDKAFPVLQKACIKNTPLKIDYCCEKSSGRKEKKEFQNSGLNLKQLLVTDFLDDTTQQMLEIVFPKANDIKKIPNRSMAYVNFAQESDALEAFKKGRGLKISSVPVVVRFRLVGDGKKAKKSSDYDENANPGAGGDKKKVNESSSVKKAAAKPVVQDSDSSDEESVKVQGKQTAMKVAQKVKKPVLQDSDDDEDVDMLDSDGEEGFEELSFEGSDFEDSETEGAFGGQIVEDSSDEDQDSDDE